MFRPLSHDSHRPNLSRNLTSRRHRQSYRCLKLLCRERRYQKVLAVCLILAILCFALHALDLLFDGRSSVTRQDYWRVYSLDLKYPFPLNALHKHNDHPVFFPTLIWLPILLYFHNDQTLLFVCGCLLTLGTLFLIFYALWRCSDLEPIPRLVLALIATLASLWMGKANIITSGGFSCMNSLAMSAVIGGFLLLEGSRRVGSKSGRIGIFFLVALAGTIASFSFGSGLAAWPAFISLCFFLKLRTGFACNLGAVGLINAAIFVAMPNDGRTEVGRGLLLFWSALPQLFAGFAEVLGAPWIHSGWRFFGSPQSEAAIYVAAFAGGCGLLLATYLLFQRFRALQPRDTAETIAVGLLVFILGSVALIVIGRGSLMATQPREVLASRYCFWTPFFWFTIPVLAFFHWRSLRFHRTAITSVALLLTACSLPSQIHFGAAYARARKKNRKRSVALNLRGGR